METLKREFLPGQLEELLFGKMAGLNETYRFSGKNKIKNQSVAEHSYWTAVIAGALARVHNSHCSETEQVNLTSIYEMSLLHDVDEVISGDIVHTFKHNEKAESFRLALDSLVQEIVPQTLFNGILSGSDFLLSWTASHKDNFESFLIKMGDWLQLLQYCYIEYKMGNTLFLPAIKKVIHLIKTKLNDERYVNYYILDVIKVFIGEVERNKIK